MSWWFTVEALDRRSGAFIHLGGATVAQRSSADASFTLAFLFATQEVMCSLNPSVQSSGPNCHTGKWKPNSLCHSERSSWGNFRFAHGRKELHFLWFHTTLSFYILFAFLYSGLQYSRIRDTLQGSRHTVSPLRSHSTITCDFCHIIMVRGYKSKDVVSGVKSWCT